MIRKILIALLFLASIVGNILLAYEFFNIHFAEQKTHFAQSEFEKSVKKYNFLARRILNENFNDILINFLDLRNDLRIKTAPYGKSFGMYFEYLPTGTSININGNNEFYAASLFKLPITMAYYYQMEKQKNKEDRMLTITEDAIDKEFGNFWTKGVGYKIKASEAIKIALKESDNTAIRMIVPLVSEDSFNHVYQALDIDLKSDQGGAILSAKGYSSILKALYFSSILEKDNSQEIIKMLTETNFIDKLPAGVPKNIPVAHKIGVFTKKDFEEGYMDCGIVYVPNRPYVLCMISHTDEETASERMQFISRTIYDYVSRAKK